MVETTFVTKHTGRLGSLSIERVNVKVFDVNHLLTEIARGRVVV